jgi:hypothetical protein
VNDKDNKTKKKKMSFTRFTNLLYEASSSLVPGTGELNSTKYTGDAEKQKDEGSQG